MNQIKWDIPQSCSGQHLSSGDCLEGRREDYQNCSAMHGVPQLSTVICVVLTDELGRVHSSRGYVFKVCFMCFLTFSHFHKTLNRSTLPLHL